MTVNKLMTQRNIPAEVLAAAACLRAGGGEAFLVGGAVRDMLLGRTPGDFDLATNLLPEAAGRCFPFFVPTGIQHGTVTVWLNPRGEGPGIEVTTYRGEEGYSDGRHPDRVTFKKSIEEDLARRDFTVNAIAMEPETGRLVDPYGGQSDLQARLLRCVGKAQDRFDEDGLRAVRAVRFAAQLEFTLHPDTKAAIPNTLGIVARVSQERVRDELMKLLGAPKPSIGLQLMQDTGLLRLLLPEVREFSQVDAAATVTARLAVLLLGAGASQAGNVMRRLKFSNAEREHVEGLVAHHAFTYESTWTNGDVRRFVARVGENALHDLFALRPTPALQARIAEVLAESRALKVTDLAITGEDVMQALALPPSRAVRDALAFCLETVLDHPELNTRELLLAQLRTRKTSA